MAGPEPDALPILLRGGLLQLIACYLHLLMPVLGGILALISLDPSFGNAPFRTLVPLLTASLFAAWFLEVMAAACWSMAPVRGVGRALGVAVLCFTVLVVWRSADLLVFLLGTLGREMMEDPFRGQGPFPLALPVMYLLEMARTIALAAYFAAASREARPHDPPASPALLAWFAPLLLLGPCGLFVLVDVTGVNAPTLNGFCLMSLLVGLLVTRAWMVAVAGQVRRSWRRLGRRMRFDDADH